MSSSADVLIQEIETWLGSFEAFLAGHPELTTAPGAVAFGWAPVVGALAYLLGSIPATPQQPALEKHVTELRGVLATLQHGDLTAAEARDFAGLAVSLVGMIEADAKAAGVPIPALDVNVGVALGAEVMPSPSAVNVAAGAQLSNAVARLALWQRAHHGQVHGGLVDAQGRENAATAALGAATASTAVETVRAIRGIVGTIIPQAVQQLTTTIRELRRAQQAANARLELELERRADRLAQRIGDLVRWLTTEALPDLETEIAAEAAARTAADRELHRGIATETVDRTSADASILTQVAPLVAWAGAFGVHTTEKVNRNEDALDQLARLDWSSLLAFASVPALVALIGKLMPHVLGASADALGGLEGAAVAALGSV